MQCWVLPAPAGLRAQGNPAGGGSLHPRLLEMVLVLLPLEREEKMRAGVQPGSDVPLSFGCLSAVGQLTSIVWRSLRGYVFKRFRVRT